MSRDLRRESSERQSQLRDSNPCYREERLSIDCSHRNSLDTYKRQTYYDNVKECRQFWGRVVSSRRRLNLKPELPEPKRRDQIRDVYMKTKSFGEVIEFMRTETNS